MGAHTGKQFLDGLRSTNRHLYLEGERVDDVTQHPALAGASQTLAGIFDRQHDYPEDCLIPDPETGEPINISHMIPHSVDDLKRRIQGLSRLSGATVGLMGRTPDYMNVKFASFAARWKDWLGADGHNQAGAHNLVAFQLLTQRIAPRYFASSGTSSAPAWGLATCSTSDFTSRRRAATGLTIICDRPTAAAPTGWSMVSSTRWTTVVDKNDLW